MLGLVVLTRQLHKKQLVAELAVFHYNSSIDSNVLKVEIGLGHELLNSGMLNFKFEIPWRSELLVA